MEDIYEFAKDEHKRLGKKYNINGDSKTKYLHLAKLMEEVGELSEAILAYDSIQRKDKLEGLDKSKQALENELADVILVIHILAIELDIDIKQALENKMIKIKNREY